MSQLCARNGQSEELTALQDYLTGALIGLARATEGNEHLISAQTYQLFLDGLRAAKPDAGLSGEIIRDLIDRVEAEKARIVPDCARCASPCGRTSHYDLQALASDGAEIRALKTVILFGLWDIAALLCGQAAPSGEIAVFLPRALIAIGLDVWQTDTLIPILIELGTIQQTLLAART